MIITFLLYSVVSLLNQQRFTSMNDIKEKLSNTKKLKKKT